MKYSRTQRMCTRGKKAQVESFKGSDASIVFKQTRYSSRALHFTKVKTCLQKTKSSLVWLEYTVGKQTQQDVIYGEQ